MSVKVVFVCLGNICRSPIAQGVFQAQVNEAGLGEKVTVDSCGTAAFNVGKSPDPRAIASASNAGYDISDQIARQVDDHDFDHADYIIAMDRANLTNLQGWTPADFEGEVKLLLQYIPGNGNQQIPDPYYSKEEAFEQVIVTIRKATAALLDHIRDKHQL